MSSHITHLQVNGGQALFFSFLLDSISHNPEGNHRTDLASDIIIITISSITESEKMLKAARRAVKELQMRILLHREREREMKIRTRDKEIERM